jgi:HTH-type transcriptional regulator / antitoxin HigA
MQNMTRISGKMIPTFNPTVYIDLLSQTLPSVIETEAEYQRLLTLTESLHFKKDRTLEEKKIYKLLVALIELYESQQYSMPASSPTEILQHIMESSGLQQTDLAEIIGVSSEVLAQIVNGKQAISPTQAQALSDRFKVSPSLFI